VTIRLPASLIEWIDSRADAGRSDAIRRFLEESRLRHAARQQRKRGPVAAVAAPLQMVTPEEANAMLAGRHYLGPLEYPPRFCIATPERDAVAIYSPPVASHFKSIADFRPIELARLWQADDADRPLSQFLAASLRWLRQLGPDLDCVFSYADPAQKNGRTKRPHNGTIYQATNFAYVGESRATDSWRTPKGETVSAAVCYRRFKTKSREKIQQLNPKWKLLTGEPKRLYVYGLQKTPAEVMAIIKGRYA
jgi:hypothetical protein